MKIHVMVDFAIRLKCGDPPDLPELSILVLQPFLNRIFSITNQHYFHLVYDNYASARRVAPWQLNRQLICFIAEVPSNHRVIYLYASNPLLNLPFNPLSTRPHQNVV